MIRSFSLLLPLLLFTVRPAFSQDLSTGDLSALVRAAEQSLEKGITFFRSLAIEGGSVYHYTLDGKERWGGRQDR